MWKRTLLLILACLGLALGPGPAVMAQSFEAMPGLQRAVVRAWLGPPTAIGEAEGSEAGTPVAGPTLPSAGTPVAIDAATMSGVVFLSIGVFEFDSDDHAVGAFSSLAEYVMQVSDSDPQFAGGSRTELTGLGDQSLFAANTVTQHEIPFSFLVATVRQGTMVYLLQGTLVRLDAATETRNLATGLLNGTATPGDGTYGEPGTSTGGLWDVFAAVEPTVLPGTEVMDATIKTADPNGTP